MPTTHPEGFLNFMKNTGHWVVNGELEINGNITGSGAPGGAQEILLTFPDASVSLNLAIESPYSGTLTRMSIVNSRTTVGFPNTFVVSINGVAAGGGGQIVIGGGEVQQVFSVDTVAPNSVAAGDIVSVSLASSTSDDYSAGIRLTIE